VLQFCSEPRLLIRRDRNTIASSKTILKSDRGDPQQQRQIIRLVIPSYREPGATSAGCRQTREEARVSIRNIAGMR